jgi:hypothetical protein
MGLGSNNIKMQGLDYSVKFLGIVWLGKTQVIPNAIIDKIQVFLIPQDKVQLHAFLGLLLWFCTVV